MNGVDQLDPELFYQIDEGRCTRGLETRMNAKFMEFTL